MYYTEGEAREQTTLFPELIDDYITNENPVRFIEAFVESLDVAQLGFTHSELKTTGRPPYHPKALLKLYLYGYLNRIRSSRMLERETKRNLEMFWLLQKLSPDHKTISNFRTENQKAIKETFKEFVKLCRKLELFGAELIAIDSTKYRASNSRSQIKDSKQLSKSIERIEESITKYLKQLDSNDEEENKELQNESKLTKSKLEKKIAFLKRREKKLKEAQKKLLESGRKYISLTDEDCRLVKSRGKIIPGYSVHNSADSKHCLISDFAVTQDAADNNHLSEVSVMAKETLEKETIKVCADAGYYDSDEIKKCEDASITTYLPTPKQRVSKKTNVPEPDYHHDKFKYDQGTDSYKCPAGENLTYYSKARKNGREILIYRTDACNDCKYRKLCTTSKRGRHIQRWEHEDVLETMRDRMAKQPEIFKMRKSIVEHPFGTMKKIWGYSTFLLRGLDKVTVEVSLMTLSYNIKRAITILGVDELVRVI